MAWFVARSLTRSGHEVVVFDDRALLTFGFKGNLRAAINRANLAGWGNPRRRSLPRAFDQAREGVNLVITVKGESLTADMVSEAATKTPVVNWYSDHPIFDQQFEVIPAYTLFCPKDSWTTARLEAMGFRNVVTLPHASAPDLLAPRFPQSPTHDVSVLGAVYPYRAHWIRALVDNGYTVSVFGSRIVPSLASHPKVTWRVPQARGAAQGDAFRTGRLTLNTHHPKDVAGGNKRVFDSAASMTLQLTEDLPETAEHLEPNRDFLPFENVEALLMQVESALASPSKVSDMAAHAYQEVLAHHSYERRLQELLGILGLRK